METIIEDSVIKSNIWKTQCANHFDHLGFLPKIATNHTVKQGAIQTRDSEKLKNNQYEDKIYMYNSINTL